MKKELKIAYRNILKNGVNSIITIIGMSVGIACVLLIYFFVSQEFSYNKFHKKKELIYRVNYEIKIADGNRYKNALLDYNLPEELEEKVPQINRSTAYREAWNVIFNYNDQNYQERLSMADSNFFKMFSFKLIAGIKEDLFKDPQEIVITQKLADKFKKIDNNSYHDFLGQTIDLGTGTPFTITGVLENIPNNSSLSFDAIIPNYKYGGSFWQSNNSFGNALVYVELKRDAIKKLAEQNIDRVLNEFYSSKKLDLQKLNVLAKSDDCFVSFLVGLNDVYLDNSIANGGYEKSSSKKYSVILIAIALVILLIASCNYIILTLGQSLKKVGEVGIRKALGAKTNNIFELFFSEGMILTFASLFFGILLSDLLIPVFGRLAPTEIYLELINFPKTILYVITGFFIVVLLTSLIPGLVFSKVRPNLMAAKKNSIGKKSNFSQFFVAFQYSISIILIVVTIFITLQTNYLKNKSVGFIKENILDINVTFLERDDQFAFNDKLKQYSGIINNTISDRNFLNGASTTDIRKNNDETVDVRIMKVDQNYISTLGLEILQGNNFTVENMTTNDNTTIVNEELIAQFDYKDNPIGKYLDYYGQKFKIIGVVKDFHFDSMKDRIMPLAMYSRINMGNSYCSILVRFRPEQLADVMSYIKKSWKEIAPDFDLDYKFWDEELETRYNDEVRWSKIIGYSSIIAIIISLLGLFGLTILLINQRIKEIGVRKVNGAKTIEIMGVLNQSFLTWLIISLIIACPVAYYIVEKWLESFPYKVPISWWVFLIAGAGALLIALITVSWQSWKVARRNPVEALRYE